MARQGTAQRREGRLVRIFAVLRTLMEGAHPTVQELAAKFGTRRGTIERDLRILMQAGYAVRLDASSVIHLDSGKAQPKAGRRRREVEEIYW